MTINYPAVRAFNRLWTPITWEIGMAEDADRGFDGGEFSSRFHADRWEFEEKRLLRVVGSRFGLTDGELERMTRDYDWEQNQREFENG